VIKEQGRAVGFVAARRNVDDGCPCNPRDLGIVKAVPSVPHLLAAVVIARVRRAPTVDDHATENGAGDIPAEDGEAPSHTDSGGWK
jgi:hypothetical protein